MNCDVFLFCGILFAKIHDYPKPRTFGQYSSSTPFIHCNNEFIQRKSKHMLKRRSIELLDIFQSDIYAAPVNDSDIFFNINAQSGHLTEYCGMQKGKSRSAKVLSISFKWTSSLVLPLPSPLSYPDEENTLHTSCRLQNRRLDLSPFH